MNKLLFALSMLLLVTSAFAQSPTIGLYADELATTRYAGVVPYTPLDLYIVASWPGGGGLAAGITAAEFKIDNLPTNVGYPTGTVTVTNTTDLVIGDLWTDYSAAWSTPQGAGEGRYTIATIEFLEFDAAWIPEGQQATVVPGDECTCLVLVDWLFAIHDAVGETFYFSSVGTETTNWSEIKSLY